MSEQAAVLDRAIQDHRAGRTGSAEAGYRSVLTQDPAQADALHLLGILACDRGDPPGALALIDTAIGLEPGRAAFHNSRGRALALSGCLPEAETAYRTAWTLRPDAAEIANNLGCLLRDRGDLHGAAGWLRRAEALAPGSGEVLGNLASALAAAGAWEASLPLFQRALALRPDDPDLHYNLARSLLSLGRNAEAERVCRAAVGLRWEHAASWNNLGLARQGQGDAKAAMHCFRISLRHDERCADAHYNLGCLLLLDNRLGEARDCQDRAIAADSLHGPALWARCMVELPILYETAAQIPIQRERYRQRLEALVAGADNPPTARRSPRRPVRVSHSFCLIRSSVTARYRRSTARCWHVCCRARRRRWPRPQPTGKRSASALSAAIFANTRSGG